MTADRDAWTSLAESRGLVQPTLKARRDAPEARFQKAITDLATALGWVWWHDHDSRRNAAGLPDLILARPGRLIVAELKVGANQCSDPQLRWLSHFDVAGVEVVEWRDGRADRGLWRTIETAEPIGTIQLGEIERRLW